METKDELMAFAVSIGKGPGCEKEDCDLVLAICDGIVTSSEQVENFCDF